MDPRLDNALVALACLAGCAFTATVMFAAGSAFVAFGVWVLRLGGVIA